jgi:hypothetical protein
MTPLKTYDIIDRLPFELAARLQCDPFFADIPVVVAEAGNLRLEIERRQAVVLGKLGKRGAAVVVPQLIADDPTPNLQFGPMRFYPQFQVIEQVELNNDAQGTKKSHRKIARRIRDVIKTANFIGLIANITPGKPCIAPMDLSKLGDLVKGSEVNFECLEISGEQFSIVQMPAFGGDGTSELTITSPTVGAQIWFTLDDTYPYPGGADDYPGSTAQLYSGPIALTEPVIVRACGYLDGSVASGINRATILNA